MEQHLFILLFITGIVPHVLSVPRRYYLIKEGNTWSDAQACCQAIYTDLAIVESTDDLIRLQNEIQRQQFSSIAWIGLNVDVNSWHWSLGYEPLGKLCSWGTGQPNNGGGIEACVMTYEGIWSDYPCTSTFPFVCFDDTKTGNQRYIYIPNSMTWYNAHIYCRTHYTDLASVRDAAEDSAIQGLTSGSIWFGLYRDSWKWTDQTNYTSIGWMVWSVQRLLEVDRPNQLHFHWLDAITGRKQIVKMKVQSSQDANDPAVKAAILAQIKQKLKDHGMAENTTVKWSEQPDGNVFYKEKDKIEL